MGNPGEEYSETRHNVGHMVVERLAAALAVVLVDRAGGAVGESRLDGKRLVVLKPSSYVNTSGPVVRDFLKSHRVPPQNLIVVHDDLDLKFGSVRVKQGGSSGGHRGLASLISALKMDEFLRARVGIGRPPGRMEPADFVLSPFTPKEWPSMEVTIAQAADAVLDIVKDGVTAAMNKYNKNG